MTEPKDTPAEQPKPQKSRWGWWLLGMVAFVVIAVTIRQCNQPSSPGVFYVVETVVVTSIAPSAIPTTIPTQPPEPTLTPTFMEGWQVYTSELYLEGEDFTKYLVAEGYGNFHVVFDFIMHDNFGEPGYICPAIVTDDWNSTALILLSVGQIAVEGFNSTTEEYTLSADWMEAPSMNVGVGQSNMLEAIAQGNILRWYLNGQMVAELEYPTEERFHDVYWNNCDPITISVETINIYDLD